MSSITEYLKQLETIHGRNLSTEANRYIKILSVSSLDIILA